MPCVQSPDIVNGEVRAGDIAGNAVNAAKIGDGAVKLVDLAAGSADGSKIIDGSITSTDIEDETIRTIDIGSIKVVRLADGSGGWVPDGSSLSFGI